ncbi:MAG TPA: T9SS type A sorting domain-containing protein [candidate division Zixibacteria bacterium]|nr:T9SS type A sorting domain-containing protein [candidate division Zixibacteria bacterium]
MSISMRVLPALTAALLLLLVAAALGDDRVPVFVDCPDTILTLHCDVAQYQLHATDPKHDHPNDNNIRYHLIEGPGQVDGRTGLWSWRPIDDSVFFGWYDIVVAASIGNSDPHTTPPEDCCRFSVFAGDHTPYMSIDGQGEGSVFFVDAPGTQVFDVVLTDEDPCDTPIVEIVKIEPEPAGSIQLVDDQLVLNLTADDDETRFVVYFAFIQNEQRRTRAYAFDTRDNPMPVFTVCPSDTTAVVCNHIDCRIIAEDPDYPGDNRFIELTLVSGPGVVYSEDWHWFPGSDSADQTYPVEIAASYGPLSTSGDENCRFAVTVEGYEIGLHPFGFADGDTVDVPASQETELVIEALGEDCQTIRQTLFTLTPEPVGYYHVGGPYGLDGYRFYKAVLVPDTADIGQYFDLLLVGSEGIGEYSVHCTIHVVGVDGVPLDVDGTVSDGLPQEFAVRQNYPNPFNAVTVVSFDLPHQSEVSFEVFNLLGQVVYDIRRTLSAGTHQVEWDGRTSAGQPVASGLYFYRLATEGFVQTKKMILMK